MPASWYIVALFKHDFDTKWRPVLYTLHKFIHACYNVFVPSDQYVYMHIHPLHAHACPFIVLRYTTTCTTQTIYNYFLVHAWSNM